jgi:hypothetical protein
MAIQTTYQENLSVPRAGTSVGGDETVDTGICETVAGIGFGLVVSQGVADKGVALGGALTDFRGITVRDVTLRPDQDDKYAQYDNVGVLIEGRVWVDVAVAVAAGDKVHFDATTGTISNTGGNGPILGARFATSTTGAGQALVELAGYNQN